MKKQFVLIINFDTGAKAAYVTEQPELNKALNEFINLVKSGMPDYKDMGMPQILSTELVPVYQNSKYEGVNI